MPTLTGDKDGHIQIEDKPRRLAGWFNGRSTPVNLGVIPTSESADSPQTSPALRPANSRSSTTHPTVSNSRFSFLYTKATPATLPTTTIPAPADDADDEFLNLDIGAALFPLGSADSSSASSFTDFKVNAEVLLLRLQTAYKLRTSSLLELISEKKAQDEELEETGTRCRHLKQQLDDMALKVLDQENTMKEMAEELATEKRMRREEEEARIKSISLVTGSPRLDAGRETCQSRKRESTASMASDSGFESGEDESPTESIVSKTGSPLSRSGTLSSRTSEGSSPEIFQQPQFPPQVLQTRPGMPPKRTSTYQKVLKGISSRPSTDSLRYDDEKEVVSTPQQWGCANCLGGNAAMAWCMVGDLKSQNKGLTARVADLENVVESSLDVIRGLSIR